MQLGKQVTLWQPGILWSAALGDKEGGTRGREKERETTKCVDVRRSVWNAV